MLEIDGAEGGGQVVRTAVALSALSGEAVRIENVRGDREEPGMRPQHLAAVEAVAALCEATVEGDEPGSETLAFRPGDLEARDVSVAVGTAGSIALVFDAVLPLAAALEGAASVTVTGGTDVQWAPPIDYFRRTKLPLLNEYGLRADVSVESRGFYPLGGGEATLSLEPSSPSPLDLDDRGSLRRLELYSTAESSLSEADVAERQASAAAEALDVDASVATLATYADAPCAGSVLVVAAVHERGRAGFSALGAAGKPSEEVAAEAVEAFRRFREGSAAVDRHLADQLLTHLALAGGELRAPEPTAHLETNREVLEAFGYGLSLDERDDGVLLRG